MHGDARLIVAPDRVFFHSHQGIGFWVFVWSDRAEKARQALAELHAEKGQGFAVLAERKDWKEGPQVLTFAGTRYALTLSGPAGVWVPPPGGGGGGEPDCDLYLDGIDQKEPENIQKRASVLVVVLFIVEITRPLRALR